LGEISDLLQTGDQPDAFIKDGLNSEGGSSRPGFDRSSPVSGYGRYFGHLILQLPCR